MPVLTKDMVPGLIKTGASSRSQALVESLLKPGDRVRAKVMNPRTHTRLPRYVRGRVGTVEADHGVFVTPDTMAHKLGPQPQHLYTVCFRAKELWGEAASGADTVRLDLWASYLERA
jgi:nitrile hydratase